MVNILKSEMSNEIGDESSLAICLADLLVSIYSIADLQANVYVMRKAWICAIHGLHCAKHGSTLCATIHGLPAQSMDCAVRKAQSSDLRKTWIGIN